MNKENFWMECFLQRIRSGATDAKAIATANAAVVALREATEIKATTRSR